MSTLGAVAINPFTMDVDSHSDNHGLECKDLSLTVQSDSDDTDINTIVRRFGITGELPQNVRVPLGDEFINITDYHTALNSVKAAESAFMAMPAEIRTRFNHDPAKLIEFVENPSNRDEAIKLGIVNAPVKVVNEPLKKVSEPVAPTASPAP